MRKIRTVFDTDTFRVAFQLTEYVELNINNTELTQELVKLLGQI